MNYTILYLFSTCALCIEKTFENNLKSGAKACKRKKINDKKIKD